jgi:hypothetical protein
MKDGFHLNSASTHLTQENSTVIGSADLSATQPALTPYL